LSDFKYRSILFAGNKKSVFLKSGDRKGRNKLDHFRPEAVTFGLRGLVLIQEVVEVFQLFGAAIDLDSDADSRVEQLDDLGPIL
jgi:hypothetical protein